MHPLPDQTPDLPLYLGCPVWSCDQWDDLVFPRRTRRVDRVTWYSRMFNTSEGNSSFYGLPSRKAVERWARDAADGFQFCMKFPREISHDRQLLRAEDATDAFLAVLSVLAEAGHLGPSFLQLGPNFTADQLPVLEAYLRGLPADLPWAVEVRHQSWFDGGTQEQRLDELLTQLSIAKVLFDSRPLFQAPPSDDSERAAQARKPKIPHRTSVTNHRPMLRLIGRNQVDTVEPFLAEWARVLANWLERGYQPYVFTHTPDDQFAPLMARRLWERVRLHLPAPQPSLPSIPSPPQQLELFD